MREQLSAGLSVESLEDRCVPAGVVRVTFRSGLLTLTGDNLDNSVRLQFGSTGRTVSIIGLDNTVIAGVNFANGVRDIRANLQGGNDLVLIWGGRIAGSVSMDMGQGTDRAILGYTNIGNKLTITDPLGILEVALTVSTIQNSTAIQSAGQDDIINVQQCTFRGPFLLNTGSGADTVNMVGTNFQGSFLTLLGNGDDTIDLTNCFFGQPGVLDGGAGADTLTQAGVLGTPVTISIP
ncbi:MAG: hypothetical protein RMJ19_01630 [Gemmatales bacterium]|nr:hypothetical protein [Gemmatales bacterium]MCS7159146.1 hypothetical protein [Gemmatales bacterium]MDW8174346.1 hypothetical protein [Gemmatales bacterium]MDW8221438.1 hypothetical protein [Gemmatales bacterium]